MIARMRWMASIGLLPTGFLVLAGCSCCGGGKSTSRPSDPAPHAAAQRQGPNELALPVAKERTASVPVADVRSYGGQKTCPVMGEPLGSMGDPIPVVVKDQTIYVCCPGCASKVRRDPDKYIAIVAAERAQ